MKILAIKSSGDRTGISLMLNDEINSFTMDHDRKDRPNWDMFLDNIGHKKIFNLSEIDLFAFENNQNSFTATRITASFLKGIATALKKPLISIEDNSENNLDITLQDQILCNLRVDELTEKFNNSISNCF